MTAKTRKSFIDYLKLKNLKNTSQRQAIVEIFCAGRGHVTAEDLHRKLSQGGRRVGAATVYRTLKLLCECGLAKEARFKEGVTMFEPDVEKAHHDHLVCTTCGRTVEFYNDTIEKLQETIARRHGFTITTHRMNLFGVCRDCRAKA